jgi:hypothetical protein
LKKGNKNTKLVKWGIRGHKIKHWQTS